jgi:hypothetical protein
MRYQLSGDVSDESAQALGRQVGAEAIMSGSLTNLGAAYRFRIKVINVETAAIEAQFAFTVQNDAQTAYLLTGKMPEPAPAPTPQPAPKPAPVVTPASSGGMTQAASGLKSTADWLAANAKAGGNYVITLDWNEQAPPLRFSYNNQNVTITLKAAGGQREVTFDTAAPSAPLFTVGAGVTLIIEENVVLKGLPEKSKPLVSVDGGAFTLNGGTLKDNKTSDNGGAVLVAGGGAFTMQGGAITGNTSNKWGGGVFVTGGTFTMNSGAISGNTASSGDGGVFVTFSGSAFTMKGGTISSNTSSSGGGGVSVSTSGTFTMHNGAISGNTASSGGGVFVTFSGSGFTMQGGSISGNTADNDGGGVSVAFSDSGFTMQGGAISGNTAGSGGGVSVFFSSAFTKSGADGVIYGSDAPAGQANKAARAAAVYVDDGRKRETTARTSTALDTQKSGPSGGWE